MRIRTTISGALAIYIVTYPFLSYAKTAKPNILLPPHDPYTSVRATGMSNAFVAVADDEGAVFLNPAGIGREDDPKLLLRGASFPNLSFGFNRGTLNLLKSWNNTKGTEGDKIEETLKQANDKSIVYGRGSAYPYLTLGRFQLGFLVDTETEGYLNSYDTPQKSIYDTQEAPSTYDKKLSLWNRSQTGPIASFSVPYRNLGISLGATARFLWRTTFYDDIEITNGQVRKKSQSIDDKINTTSGIAYDAGILYTAPTAWAPSFGFAARDLGDSYFKSTSRGHNNEIEKMNLVGGFSIQPIGGPQRQGKRKTVLILSTEGTRLNDTRVKSHDKFRIGGELRFGLFNNAAPLSFRLGHNLKGLSYGGGIDLIFIRLDAGSEVKSVDGESGPRLDRRTYARISVDLRT